MTDLIHLRRHRFDALHALVTGDIHGTSARTFMARGHLRRDIGLPEVPAPASNLDPTLPLIGLPR